MSSTPTQKTQPIILQTISQMLTSISSFLRRLRRRKRKPKLTVTRLPNSNSNSNSNSKPTNPPTIRLATFNAAMFSMAPAVPTIRPSSVDLDIISKSSNDRPKSILKQRSLVKSTQRVSINLPDNEIERTKRSGHSGRLDRGKEVVGGSFRRSLMEVLREVRADVVALQNVKAEEEKGMRPLSELADGLGMNFVFAETWAPQYGNAILSKWPIKRWKVHRIFEDDDHRNVLKATIDVPKAGELNFHCTYLDHLDENCRMKQINKILQTSEGPHILAGGLNSLDETDYSKERWTDIVKYYEEIGKPTPKIGAMRFLREKQYLDAKNFAGECESVVIMAKGQDVQGTCKYGTRVDYLLASPNSPYKFVPGSYMVLSSKGTSDHHIVKVDVQIVQAENNNDDRQHHRHPKPKVVKINSATPKGIWSTNS